MCEDLAATVSVLQAKHIAWSPPIEQEWGIRTTLRLPSGGHMGLYQPARRTMLRGAR
jgi:hypothetical protein